MFVDKLKIAGIAKLDARKRCNAKVANNMMKWAMDGNSAGYMYSVGRRLEVHQNSASPQ